MGEFSFKEGVRMTKLNSDRVNKVNESEVNNE